MEHSFHLMLHGQIETAKQKLSEAESWRHGKETASQYQRTKLIQAYRSLLDYIIWFEKKSRLPVNGEKKNHFLQTPFFLVLYWHLQAKRDTATTLSAHFSSRQIPLSPTAKEWRITIDKPRLILRRF